MVDWNILISPHDPLSDNSLLFLSDLPFSENFKIEFEKLKIEDKIFLKKVLKDSIVVDLGSGNPSSSVFVRNLSEESRSLEYIGIDQRFPSNVEFRLEQHFSENDFQSTYVREEIVTALNNFPKMNSKLVFFFIGLEPVACDCPDFENYVARLFFSINKISCKELYLVFSFGTHGIDPWKFGFDIVRNVVNWNVSVYKIFSKPF